MVEGEDRSGKRAHAMQKACDFAWLRFADKSSETGDRNPRYARGKPHQEIQSEILTCGLQGSHTETDDQKIPIVLNDYRDFLVSLYPNMSNTVIL